MKKGFAKGSDRVNQLIIKLGELKRIDDIIQSAKDPAYQKQLLEEFGLLDTEDRPDFF